MTSIRTVWLLTALLALFLGGFLSSQEEPPAAGQSDVPKSPPEARKRSLPPRVTRGTPDRQRGVHPNVMIEQKLSQYGSFEFPDAPVADVVDLLRKQLEIPFVIDKGALEEVGIGTDFPITLAFSQIRGDRMLDFLCRDELAWIVRDGYVLLTTDDKLTDLVELRVYNCGDLLAKVDPSSASSGGFGGASGPESGGGAPGLGPGLGPSGLEGTPGQSGGFPGSPAPPVEETAAAPEKEAFDDGALIELIEETVLPDSWHQNRGPGTIMSYHGGLLVVQHHYQAQRKIALLLDMLRQAQQDGPGFVVRD